jgi:peptidoglycan/LPS O-acetylase OafA/YrhL
MNFSVLFWAMIYLWLILIFIEYIFLRRPLLNVYPLLVGLMFVLSVYEQRVEQSHAADAIIMAVSFPVLFLIAHGFNRVKRWLYADSVSSVWVMFLVLATASVSDSLQENFFEVRAVWFLLIAVLHVIYCRFVMKTLRNNEVGNTK